MTSSRRPQSRPEPQRRAQACQTRPTPDCYPGHYITLWDNFALSGPIGPLPTRYFGMESVLVFGATPQCLGIPCGSQPADSRAHGTCVRRLYVSMTTSNALNREIRCVLELREHAGPARLRGFSRVRPIIPIDGQSLACTPNTIVQSKKRRSAVSISRRALGNDLPRISQCWVSIVAAFSVPRPRPWPRGCWGFPAVSGEHPGVGPD